jgi:DeoR family transcriptional regulator, suf operon transcriptional repressor
VSATTADPGQPDVTSGRKTVIVALKRGGPQSVEQLATTLGISIAGTRRQLVRLTEDGLVERRRQPESASPTPRGRPAYLYEASQAADGLFPQRYGDLTTELLGYLGGPQSTEVGRLFDLRRQRRLDAANRRLDGLSLAERVETLATILDQDGYVAEAVALEPGHWRIVEHHCAIRGVAEGFAQACGSELAFIRAALTGTKVERVAHLMDGAHMCAYDVQAVDTLD